jgi:MFS family permease
MGRGRTRLDEGHRKLIAVPEIRRSGLPRGVVALGFVSLLMDASSEMIHSLLPVFLVSVLGASALSVGVIEGIAEATASLAKVFSGTVSDWVGKRRPLVLLGYGMAALTKPLFPLAHGVGAVLTARFVDRIGKGIRGAPEASRGAAFGLRQSMDTVGAFLGPAIAIALMAASGDNFRLVFWIAVVPAFAAVAVIVLAVREPERREVHVRRSPLSRSQITRLDRRYWLVVAFAAVLTLARFSEAFLLLRAQGVGLRARYIPLVLIVMNIAYAASAYPFGRASDRLGKRGLLTVGIVVLIAADLVLAGAGGVWAVLVGAALWGVHMGATQGILSAMVADRAPSDLRGTGFGLFNLVSGGALLVASLLAGALWTAVGPASTFLAGAGLAALALIGLSRVQQQGCVRGI